MQTCAKCDAVLGGGRFCMNCGHPVGAAVAEADRIPASPTDVPLTSQTPPPDRRWAIVGGVAILVLVLVVIASCVAGGDEDPSTRSSSSGPTTSGPTEPVTTPTEKATPASSASHTNMTRQVTATASSTAASTREADGSMVSFDAAFMVDGRRSSAWRVPGDGSDVELTFAFPGPTTVSKVGLVNGLDKKVAGIDWYPLNRRITKVVWLFDDGTRVVQKPAARRQMQRMEIPPVTTTTIRLRIRSTTPPGEGLMGRDYTAISDVTFAGAPA